MATWDPKKLKESTLDNLPENLDEGTKAALQRAQEAALSFNHNYIGSEHLLLGLLRDEQDAACQMLNTLGVSNEKASKAVEFIIGRGDRRVLGDLGLTPRSKKIIRIAQDVARQFRNDKVSTTHLLLGIVKEGEGIAAGVLESLGVNFTTMYDKFVKMDLLTREDLEKAAEEAKRQPGFREPRKYEFSEDSKSRRRELIIGIFGVIIFILLLKRLRRSKI